MNIYKQYLNAIDPEELESLKRFVEYPTLIEPDSKKKHRSGGNNRKKVKRKKARNGR